MDRLFNFSVDKGRVKVDYKYFLADEFGLCYVTPDKKHTVIPIPKNGSTEINHLCKNWHRTNYKKLIKPVEHCVFLRDPIQRWISGITEFLIGQTIIGRTNQCLDQVDIEATIDSPMFQNLLFNFAIFDDHTLPQCCFIQGLRLEEIAFFYLDDTAVPKLAKHLNQDLEASRLNATKGNLQKEFLSHKIQNLVSKNQEFANRIETHFYADHQLLDIVKFQ